jgi:hypothetical protein
MPPDGKEAGRILMKRYCEVGWELAIILNNLNIISDAILNFQYFTGV